MTKKAETTCRKQWVELLLISHFADDGVTLYIPDRDAKDYLWTVHDEAVQPVCMLLQQRSTLCTMEHSWDNDRVENVEVGLRADLFLVPENENETTKGLWGLADPGVHLQIGTIVILNDASQVLEIGGKLNRGLIG